MSKDFYFFSLKFCYEVLLSVLLLSSQHVPVLCIHGNVYVALLQSYMATEICPCHRFFTMYNVKIKKYETYFLVFLTFYWYLEINIVSFARLL